MFGLGMGELLVIMVIALLVLGPKKLPDLATTLGKAIRSFRKATRDLTNQLEIDDEVKQPLRELRAALRDDPAPYVPPKMAPAAGSMPASGSVPGSGSVPASGSVPGSVSGSGSGSGSGSVPGSVPASVSGSASASVSASDRSDKA